MSIQCPQCGARLRVPKLAAGQYARCPRCQVEFFVPVDDSMLDDTVMNWLMGDAQPPSPPPATEVKEKPQKEPIRESAEDPTAEPVEPTSIFLTGGPFDGDQMVITTARPPRNIHLGARHAGVKYSYRLTKQSDGQRLYQFVG